MANHLTHKLQYQIDAMAIRIEKNITVYMRFKTKIIALYCRGVPTANLTIIARHCWDIIKEEPTPTEEELTNRLFEHVITTNTDKDGNFLKIPDAITLELLFQQKEEAEREWREAQQTVCDTVFFITPHTPIHTYGPLHIPMCTPMHPYTPICTPMHPYTPMCTPMHPYTPIYTPMHPYTPMCTPMHPYTPVCTPMHPYTPIYTHMHPYAPIYTYVHLYAPI